MVTRRRNVLAACCFAATGLSGVVTADELPRRKAGLWESTTTIAGMPAGPGAMQQCVGEETDDLMQQEILAQDCSAPSIKSQEGRVTIDQVCRTEGTTITSHVIFTGDFESAYQGEISSTYDPPMAGMEEGKVLIAAKYLGPCGPDQRPGDVIMPGGMKFNLLDSVD